MNTNNFLPLDHHNSIISSHPPPPPPPPVDAAHLHNTPLFLFHMAFYWGKEAHFWFSGWPDNNSGMYALALILVFALAILVEFLSGLNLVKPGANRVAAVLFQAGIHAVRAGFSYMVMLAVVSYNGGVFIVALLGHAVGYVIFGSRLTKKD